MSTMSTMASTAMRVAHATSTAAPTAGTKACRQVGAALRSPAQRPFAAPRVARLTVRASSADFSESSESTPIEVVESVQPVESAPMPPAKIVVLGGNGFVGSEVCKEALQQGMTVVSINRSGPPSINEPWVDRVDWVNADVFDESSWSYTLPGAAAVISCIGGFATTAADMERICGDATIAGVGAAVAAGVPRFVFVSVHDYNIPDFLKDQSGYFSGKKRAEDAVLLQFPEGGAVLRPGFIYGSRLVPQLGVTVPLNLVGEPVQKILSLADQSPLGALAEALKPLPASDVLLAPPVSVESVAATALKCISDPSMVGVIDIEAIQTA
uniref:NAD(P)-binding domain-containing protein n=1 Tax=Pyramimonas obovata TaxID=1411642 RepID=A0A7S0MZM9_9CHLO|mmetsp:Transcript_17232/g.37481  ORF Transcript_17232/g.37481 Transcript_17232/m.37481 type:complete len:326 (+) Transcript_17232:3-980(+)